MTNNLDYQKAVEKLGQYGQEHVLKYYEELSEEQKEQLLREKDAEIKELNREIGALQAQLEQAGLTPVNKKVAV